MTSSLSLSNSPRTPLRVVIVDDLRANLKVLSLIFRRTSHEVTAFLSGAEALAHLAHHPADLALIDLQMPGMDGFETVRSIRALPGISPRICLIAFTADVRRETTQACLAAGFDECLHKPIRPTALQQCIDRLLPPPARAP